MIPKWRARDQKQYKIPKNPTEMQKLVMETLFEDPDKRLTEVATGDILHEDNIRPPSPPDFIRTLTNTGPGSGEFHVYRIQRKFENRRVKFFEHQVKLEKAQAEFDQTKKMLDKLEKEKTEARREKRIQKRMKAQERKKLHKQFASVLNEHNKKMEESQ
ncbi:PRKR-interacting protein 1 [Thelohanellus kitauei]|uniref:PRKR-interacting protein 1 n=1 Tax=Thelohanellus kitauei TaxID=669202 RepID=A0A0C2I7A5_THEKT|nr:PRKR-interacting protein 1 [Thelohanellus kitauei]